MRSRLRLVALGFAILAFSSIPALAGFYSGNDLVELMRESDKSNEAGSTAVDWAKVYEYGAYVLGVYDATEHEYNTPERITKGQVIAIVSKYLKNNPEKWTHPADTLVKNALKEAFPLKQKP